MVARIPKRIYFYEIDVHGQLFLEETKHKNFTTCFKSLKFLDFFYDRLQNNSLGDPHFNQGYKYISPCGPEINYIKAHDAPIVFHTLKDSKLVHSGTRTIDFDPNKIFVSKSTGYIYHRLDRDSIDFNGHKIGLLKSSLVMQHLYSGLDMDNSNFEYRGTKFPLYWIE